VRYLARKFDFYGTGEIEMAQCDMYSDCLVDYGQKLVEWIWCPQAEAKKELQARLVDEHLPKTMDIFEKKLAEPKSSGFVIGSKLTFVDVALFRVCEAADDNYLNAKAKIFENYPLIGAWFERVSNLPGIAEWIANRPNYLY